MRLGGSGGEFYDGSNMVKMRMSDVMFGMGEF